MPRVVFTDPQAAAVGAGEARFSATAPLSEVSRTATYAYAESKGFLTLLSDGETVTGAYAPGPEAGEWLQQATVAIRARIPLEVLRDTMPQSRHSARVGLTLHDVSSRVEVIYSNKCSWTHAGSSGATRVNYLNFDLGSLSGGESVSVALTGVESDVMLMTPADVRRYSAGQQATYYGGHYRKSPARIRVPGPGAWHVIVVPGPGGRVQARVSVSG